MNVEGSRPFRWQALLQRVGDAFFVLDRRRRLLFVNHAWEQLAGTSADRVRGLLCRRNRPVGPDESLEDLLAHLLAPPPEALKGAIARTRRLFIARDHRDGQPVVPVWWDIEFFPLRQTGSHEGHLLLGRVMPVFDTSKSASESSPVLPARLEGMRLQQVSRYSFDLLASVAPPMQRLTQQVRLASQVSANVLLVGERGTGKESLARLIHYQGGSRERSFVALDCRVLPPACVADVLLAERSGPLWPGLGAIYLDEPAFLPRDLQLRLCEWLAEHGDRAVPRLFVGSCQEPSEDVRAGRLLDELHWRLGTVILHVPTLRQRLADLPALVERFLAAGVGKDRGPVQGLTTAAWEALRAYPWPGNLAELRRVLETARLQARGDHLDVDDFPLSIRLARQLELDPARSGPRTLVLEEVLEQVERRLIQLALLRARGNRSQAAELLGIHRPRLLRRMEALKIDSREETD